MQIEIINRSKHPLPKYETSLSAGMDLHANIDQAISLKPMQRALVKTGLFIALPDNYEAQIRPRSGLAYKKGISLRESSLEIQKRKLMQYLFYRGWESHLIYDKIKELPFSETEA